MKLTKNRLNGYTLFILFSSLARLSNDKELWDKYADMFMKKYSSGQMVKDVEAQARELMNDNPKRFLEVVDEGHAVAARFLLFMQNKHTMNMNPEEKCWAFSHYTDECDCYNCSHNFECSASGVWRDDNEEE